MPGYRLFMKETKSRRTLEQERVRTFDPLIHEAAKRHGVDKPLVLAVVKVESDFDPAAVSCKGAQGLMQLMPETARLLGVKDCFDPKDNIEGGVKHLRSLLDKFEGRLSLALAAYNAGKDAVLEYGGIPPFPETKGYVEKVIQYYNFYKSDGGR
jgi:soluble lytic murein transglycosylase-like protein